jgi:uncharacterized protein YjdB
VLAPAVLAAVCLFAAPAAAQDIVRLTVRPQAVELAIGEVLVMTAEATLADGNVVNVTEAVEWRSSAGSVARVSNTRGARGRVTARAVGQASISVKDPLTGISSGQSGGSATVAVLGRLASIEVAPKDRRLEIGQTRAMTATGTYNSGAVRDLTERVEWVSSNTVAVVVSNEPGQQGRVTAVAPGSASISATLAGVSSTNTGGDGTVRVPATLVSVRVTPAENRLPIGFTVSLDAVGTFDDGSTDDVTNDVVWTSSNPAVAVVSNDPGTEGEVHALQNGTTVISVVDPETGVASGPSGGDAVVSVTGQVVSLIINPAQDQVPTGLTRNLSVRATLDDGSSFNLPRRELFWSSSAPAIASVSNDRLSAGVVTGVARGVAVITATHPATGISTATSGGDATITVLGRMVGLVVRPRLVELFSGQSDRFNAIALLDDGSEARITRDVEFVSSNGGVALVDANRGEVTGQSKGNATVSAVHRPSGLSSSQFSGDATVQVRGRVEQLEVDPARAYYVLGTTPKLRARATLDDGSSESLRSDLVWTSSDPAIASVANESPNKGVLTPNAVGRVTITALEPVSGVTTTQSGGDGTVIIVDGLTSLAVRQPEGSDEMRTGDFLRLRAFGSFPNPSPDAEEPDPTVEVDMSTVVEYTSSNPAVVRVDNGRVLAVGLGEATVSARDPRTGILSSQSGGDATFRVIAALTQVRMTPRLIRVRIGVRSRAAFSAIGIYTDGSRLEISDRVTFSTANAGIAVVHNEADRHGRVEGVARGVTVAQATEPITGIQSRTARIVVRGGRRGRGR